MTNGQRDCPYNKFHIKMSASYTVSIQVFCAWMRHVHLLNILSRPNGTIAQKKIFCLGYVLAIYTKPTLPCWAFFLLSNGPNSTLLWPLVVELAFHICCLFSSWRIDNIDQKDDLNTAASKSNILVRLIGRFVVNTMVLVCGYILLPWRQHVQITY